MYPRVNYEMMQEDCDMIMLHIGGGPSRQDNANRAWSALGQKMGFDYMTVKPIPGKGMRFFSAVPSENETQRTERLAREAEEKRLAEITRLSDEIAERQTKLAALKEKA